jgi:hypothetical protein
VHLYWRLKIAILIAGAFWLLWVGLWIGYLPNTPTGQHHTVRAPTTSAGRPAQLFREHSQPIFQHGDRMFARLMILQWLAGIVVALLVFPERGPEWKPHSFACLDGDLFGAAIGALSIFLGSVQPGASLSRHAIAIGQMLTSALLIHLSGGRIETHFHVFGSLAFLAVYRNWRFLVSAAPVVAEDHLVRGIWMLLKNPAVGDQTS